MKFHASAPRKGGGSGRGKEAGKSIFVKDEGALRSKRWKETGQISLQDSGLKVGMIFNNDEHDWDLFFFFF